MFNCKDNKQYFGSFNSEILRVTNHRTPVTPCLNIVCVIRIKNSVLPLGFEEKLYIFV